MQTHRLDPSQIPIVAASAWLLDRSVDGALDLSRTLVATPGARAGRVLVTLLAQAGQERGVVVTPPQTVTAGRLAEALAPMGRPAGEVHRVLAWQRTLCEAPRELLAQVLPASGEGSAEPEQWASELARAADELARGGFRCGDLVDAPLPPLEPPERWRALGGLQQRYESILREAGLVDAALHALDAPVVAADLERVVLLMCTDLTNSARSLLRRAPCPVHVLRVLEEGLHADGVVDEAYWRDADIDIDPETVFVTGGPGEQAMLAVRAAVDLGTSAMGTADERLAGAVRRGAEAHGLRVHVASGSPVLTSGPAGLLRDLTLLLRERSFAALARVLRNPVVVSGLRTQHPEFGKLPRGLDEYLEHAAPTRAFGALPEGHERAARARKLVLKARRHVLRAIRPLRGSPRSLRAWADGLREALVSLLEPAEEALGEPSMAALGAIAEQLRVLADLPAPLDTQDVPAHEAITVLLTQLANASIAPEPASEELDLLGWLELPLDPSPGMVILGMHDNVLPEPPAPSPLVPEGLRRALGLPGQDRTIARDAANLASLLFGARQVRFVLGTSNAAGDPLLPSTLLLRASGDGTTRVLSRGRDAFETPPATEPRPCCAFRVGVMAAAPTLDRMAVTSFRTYLESPYLFYLRHALKLREIEPAGPIPRLEASTFGTLIHEALREFASQEEHRDVVDENSIRQLMHACLWETAERIAGRSRSAIMMAQIDAAERRLASLAPLEAARRRAGWRTIATEWRPPDPTPLSDTGIVLTGSIDRIDWNEQDGTLALLDYKTSERARRPGSTHRRRDGSWIDLQLPLYEILARPIATEHGIEQPPSLGYIALTRTDAQHLDSGWSADDLESAVACAEGVAREVRRGLEAMRELGRPKHESALTRLAGLGLLLDPEHDLLRPAGMP